MRVTPAAGLGAALALASALGVGGAAVVAAQTGPSRSLRDVLVELARITDAEWAAIERGEAIAKTLETGSAEIAVAGVVRIAAASDQLVARYRDLDALKRSSQVLDIGRFSTPPAAADLARVPLEERGLDLRACRPADCVVRLSAADIARFHTDVPWTAPDWRQRSASVWREVLAAHASAYARDGRRALPVFVNKSEPLSVGDELAGLVGDFGFVAAFSPEFLAYMREFRPSGLPGAEQVLFWSKEDFGVRPIIRLSHQIIYRVPSAQPVTILATNQIYADHYLDAALSVTLAIETIERRFYLISVSRARSRSLTGLVRSLVRSTVRNRSREAVLKMLTSAKRSLETP
jgi:hypothetical protein